MKSRKLFKVCALLMLAVMSCLLFSGCGGQSEQKKFVITYLPNNKFDTMLHRKIPRPCGLWDFLII